MLLEFQTLFQALPISWTQYIGGGWAGGGGEGGWGAEGWSFHTFERKSSHRVFIEVHRQPCTAHLPGWYSH